MKTLNNHVILYDAECPMCNMYTKAFVQTGLLATDGRAPYQSLNENTCPVVDRQRAVNEIALVNQETGEVTYGIKSLFKILANAVPALRYIFNFGPFISLMSRVYAFVSYNRRVIIPVKISENFQYQPTFKLKYRIAYLFFTWAITSFILTAYTHLLIGVVPIGNAYREYLVCGGQIFFQGLIVTLIAKEKRWDYLGNMMTISLAGSLLLGFVLLAAHWIGHQPIFYTAYFMLVAGLMFLEHIRRTKLLQLGWTLTITWALYRVAILVLILLIN
jgi:predicted DCC family thiol-disulfide oxidoreductase YuxK